MSDVLLVFVALVLIVAAPMDIYVAIRLTKLAIQRPYISSLNAAALRSWAIAMAGCVFAVLGVQSVWFVSTGERLLPTPIPTLLIVLGAIVVSLPNIYFLRLLRRFSVEADEWRRHKRDGEQTTQFHRRASDDVPPSGDAL